MQPMFDKKRPVFIIGGGPSLRGFDWNRLRRKQCIALNLAYRPVNWADAMFFSSNEFLYSHGAVGGDGVHFWQLEKASKIITTASHCGGCKGGKENRIEYVPPSTLDVISDPSNVMAAGKGTGAQAILLAHHLGASKIVLLGFDNKPGHWAKLLGKHYAYARAPEADVFDAYAEQFAEIAKLGLDVVNATPDSALDCFPIADPSTFL